MNPMVEYRRAAERNGLKESEHVLIAHLGEKILRLSRYGELIFTSPFSYSKRPPCCSANSYGTPWGLHEIAEKHGAGAPPGTVFSARVDTGTCYWQRADAGAQQMALVTTRILRLGGLEPGINCGPGVDSLQRFIYLHGTNFPERFPENLSAGCLLLRDAELITLYDLVPCGTHVFICKPSDHI